MTRCFLSIIILILWTGQIDAQQQTRVLQRYEFSHLQMGTTFKIVVYAEREYLANAAIDSCWKRLSQLNLIFSDYEEESECTFLSDNAGTQKWVTISDEMWSVIRWADCLSNRSDGAFDVTLGALTKLWRRAIRQDEQPEQQHIDEARGTSGFRFVDYDTLTQSVRLQKKGMRLDFGGIAKGYAIDELYQVLMSYDLPIALVDGGGDIYVGEKPPDTKGWRIQMNEEGYQYLENIAIATSGDQYKNIQVEDLRFSHIVDAQSGYGIESLAATESTLFVTAHSCMEADALATTLSVMSANQRQKLVDQYTGSNYSISVRKKKNQGRK